MSENKDVIVFKLALGTAPFGTVGSLILGAFLGALREKCML